MNLDRFSILICLTFLPLLWLPYQWFAFVILLFLIVVLYGLYTRCLMLLVFALVMGGSYYSVWQFAKKADNQTAGKYYEKIEITRLVKQSTYQTAIAKRENNEQIYLHWQSDVPLVLGATYQAELQFRPISARANIGNFDRQRWYFAQHLQGSTTVREAKRIEREQSTLRQAFLTKVQRQTETLAAQGLLLALAFGERAWINEHHWQIFQKTSTAHLIAISGLHIGLAFLCGFWCAKALQWCLLRCKSWQAVGFYYFFAHIIGIIFAIGYSYFAGFSIPTIRALTAICFVLLCRFLRYHYTPWQYWWRVVTVLLLFDPITVLSDSFWLSILAVMSLLIWYQYFPLSAFLRKFAYRKWGKIVRFCLGLIHLQCGILLIFTPVQFFFFEGISLTALPANLVIVPLYSFVLVPLVLIGLLTDNGFNTWQLANRLIGYSLDYLETISQQWIWLSHRQQAQWLIIDLAILFILYGILHARTALYWYKRYALLLCCQCVFYLFQLDKVPLQWITFDVGQGLAQAFIYYDTSGQKKAIFYDTGIGWGKHDNGGSMASIEILPYLRRHQIEVEAIFLSHDDNDHSGGAADLLNAYPNARLISSSLKPYANVQPEACIQGKRWRFGRLEFEAVYPKERVERAKNADSCIILAKFDRFQILLTGDTGIEQERKIAELLNGIDFLQVAHHGSKTSSSHTLLAKSKPQLAVVSVGRWNPWRMPHPKVVERFEQHKIPLVTTAKQGMIIVNFDSDKWQLKTARNDFSPWYRRLYGKNR
ncbi:DNA internalization-related competence protein ComEC/Rec2 [Actinobacillus pleuropneumoniae]|uniref:DNA internalization-related competence protein ComEC/Rec2 n=1 Tax=Actinobacillus pleuropneumoniae TaxID=715 RepID=A0ABN5MI01_ACTPL|nr:DNA internalization-related competence protein ComEC/Rec2 [Actinobacillus pleuropneumoniae]ASU16736.1 ComE operon protein 3 [Actinobacillus pleuropneumoniae]AWG95175.1 DNA internalization-related competence protein ComEC/Rec2 [Actinobacillus pleuropneumoniae serovar 1 str. 4074]AXA21246.1 DNA internalization-related competence protein ComEC/Rec2 [Actinobacillus pleuropneumoniae]MBL4535672.1 DNA internalization-related competence protein ComEC/Rec2 [Actinobacillus pleuropneumoniae]MCI1068494